MKEIAILFLLFAFGVSTPSDKQLLNFEFEGTSLHGVLNIPDDIQPKGIVLIVHGSGRTNAVAQNWHADVRGTMHKAGYATFMWDKMGCGKSGGTFNYNQTVQNSAAEVIAAINHLKKEKIPGSDKIGLWGISRAGWINPIVINEYKDIAFWISVSGVDDKENFSYLLEENLTIAGVPDDSVRTLVGELIAGYRISHAGGDYESYTDATPNLRTNKFLHRFNNGHIGTEEGYYTYQQSFMKEKLDEATGLQVYVPDLDSMLTNIHCPVLALFGEKDKNVDWRKTKSLYQETLAKHADLTIASFPDCNHNLVQCETGGFYEFQDNDLPWKRCDGFLDTMAQWLHTLD
ncbi:MAG: alpha/beta hydrolase family protein [Bacteroidia bacterium]